jgi:hypothetical protein
MRSLTWAAAALMLATPLLALAQQNAVAADPCARYKWDVARERALLAAAASPIAAAKDGASPPRIATDRAYRVQLVPASQVTFPTAPGKASATEGNYSGVLTFTVPVAGSYRVAVDVTMWIDVVAGSHLVPAADYQGQQGCDAPRKIVQFYLPANEPLILQLSGVAEPSARVTIVRAVGG